MAGVHAAASAGGGASAPVVTLNVASYYSGAPGPGTVDASFTIGGSRTQTGSPATSSQQWLSDNGNWADYQAVFSLVSGSLDSGPIGTYTLDVARSFVVSVTQAGALPDYQQAVVRVSIRKSTEPTVELDTADFTITAELYAA